jgi:hypothetical protein
MQTEDCINAKARGSVGWVAIGHVLLVSADRLPHVRHTITCE